MRHLAKNLTFRVLVGIALGALLGTLAPAWGISCKLLSDIFVRLIQMVIAPLVFLTISVGIANMGDLKKVGILGGKTLLYFEVMTTLALALGLAVVSLIQPGRGFDHKLVGHTVDLSQIVPAGPVDHGWKSFALRVVPDSFVGALAHGDMLPVLLLAVLCGATLAHQGSAGASLCAVFERLVGMFFGIIHIIMKMSPLAAFGAMAYTVGTFGLGSLAAMGKLMLAVYVAMALFIFGVLGGVCRLFGFRLWRVLHYIRSELLLVLGTSSSESVLPVLMDKLEAAGCKRSVVALVLPTGYSFNLDGTSIYLSMATLFIAQAYDITLTWSQIGFTMAVLMLTSKGAAGVTGSGFVTLAATLAAMPGHPVPPEGVALVIGVDRFLSEARALTNVIGNSVACLVMAENQGDFSSSSVALKAPSG